MDQAAWSRLALVITVSHRSLFSLLVERGALIIEREIFTKNSIIQNLQMIIWILICLIAIWFLLEPRKKFLSMKDKNVLITGTLLLRMKFS